MAKDFQAGLKRDEALGLNPDELAFYNALANNESAVRELGDDTLKRLASELTEKLRTSTTSTSSRSGQFIAIWQSTIDRSVNCEQREVAQGEGSLLPALGQALVR